MDFKALREQILANIENYSAQETKIVVTKLLDFLVDINEKRSKLESENKSLFEEMNSLKNKNGAVSEDYKSKVDEIVSLASEESKKITNKAHQDALMIVEEAQKEAQALINETNTNNNELIESSIEKIREVINQIKEKDDEVKLYRRHILSIFRKTIFRFSNTNYYIIRADDKDFRDLLHFFELDELLQKECDDNMKKLAIDPTYQMLLKTVEENVDREDLMDIKDIFQDEKVTVDNKQFEMKENFELKEAEDISLEEIEEEIDDTITKGKSKFLDVMNRYKNNK